MALPVPALTKGRLACSDVVKCVYDLGDQEMRVYETLNDLGEARTEDIAQHVERDPSVVYRNLQRLVSCGVVKKTKSTYPEGGYFFTYRSVPKKEVKAHLRACVDDWHAQMRKAVERL